MKRARDAPVAPSKPQKAPRSDAVVSAKAVQRVSGKAARHGGSGARAVTLARASGSSDDSDEGEEDDGDEEEEEEGEGSVTSGSDSGDDDDDDDDDSEPAAKAATRKGDDSVSESSETDGTSDIDSGDSDDDSGGDNDDSEDGSGDGSDGDDSDDAPAVRKASSTAKAAAPAVVSKSSKAKAQQDVKAGAGAGKGPSDAAAAGVKSGSGSCNVYVEGIAYDAKESDLQTFFEPCGKIVSIRMPTFQDSGRSLGYAHVDFATPAAAADAVAKDGQYLLGRFLSVEYAKPKRSQKDVAHTVGPRPSDCTTLFVTNLPYDAEEDTVKDAFSAFGEVVSVRLARWNHTQSLKGFGYVQFRSGEGAEAAMAAPSIEVDGRGVFMDYDTGAPKRSFKTGQGQNWDRFVQRQEQGSGSARGSGRGAGPGARGRGGRGGRGGGGSRGGSRGRGGGGGFRGGIGRGGGGGGGGGGFRGGFRGGRGKM